MEILTGEADFRSPEEYVKLDAQDIIKKAASSGTGVLEQLNLRYPVQDEMPMMFRGDACRDKYFQQRLDDRAKRWKLSRLSSPSPASADQKLIGPARKPSKLANSTRLRRTPFTRNWIR